jgi:F-box protein 33
MVWIDSMRMQEYRNIMELLFRTEQDPLVMAAWRCKKLEEIIMHGNWFFFSNSSFASNLRFFLGYILDSHNLVGISRLRGHGLKKLEVSRVDLSISSTMLTPFIEVISF